LSSAARQGDGKLAHASLMTPWWVRCNERLGRGLILNVPTRKDEDRRMAPQRSGECLRALDTEINAVSLDCGNRRLRDTCEIGKLGLREFLELAHDLHRFTHGDADTLLRPAELTVLTFACSHVLSRSLPVLESRRVRLDRSPGIVGSTLMTGDRPTHLVALRH